MIRAMAAVDPYAHTICQAAHDAVRALLSTAPDSPEGSAALREVTAWLAREHGPAALLDLAEELAEKDSSTVQRRPATRTSSRSGTTCGE